MKPLQHYWYQPNVLIWLLLPLSWLYCFIVIIRRRLYQLNILKSFGAQVPVVVIGNIVAGGSGKTPLLISLCDYLQQRGHKPGVVSRGYGGEFTGIRQVQEDDLAQLVGDEPLMICQRAKVPVVVAADRVAAVNYLLTKNQCDIVLSDDGLQHYRMKRDFEIAVVDAGRRFGNGFCLPAGPLRERVSRLDDVDMVVYNGVNTGAADNFFYTLRFVSLRQLNGTEHRPLSSFVDEPVHAVAGIGNPARFFLQLREHGITVIEHAFADHHLYQQSDFSGWQRGCIIMTEKDAVKCGHLLLENAWVLTVQADFSSALESRLDAMLLPLLEHKLNQ